MRSILASPAIVLLALSLAVGWWGGSVFTAVIGDETRRRLEAVANLLQTEATQNLAQESPAAWVEKVARQTGLRIALLDPLGQFVADSHPAADRAPNETAREEILAARNDGRGFAWRSPRPGEARCAHLAFRLGSGASPDGFLRVSACDDPLDGPLVRLRTACWTLGAIGALVLGLCSWRASRMRLQPLRQLEKATEAMALGDFEVRLRSDELGPLAQVGVSLARLAQLARERTAAGASDRHKVAAVLGAMVEGVIAVDGDQSILHMNAAAARILGLAQSRTEGRPVREVTRVPEVGDILTAVFASGHEQNRELRVVMPPRDRWIEMHAAPLRAADGEVGGAVLVLHDVTELRRLESMRRDFVANVSHELKTPIAAIRGIVETVLDDEAMEPDTRTHFLGRAREQSLRLSTLVSDLLTLSRVESGDAAKDRAPVDLRMLLRECAQHVAGVIEPRHLSVDVQVPEEPVVVSGDVDSLRLVVSNLLDNAVKYSPDRGRIGLRLAAHDGRARIEVEDHGIGIERKHLERIFQRFYRVDKARSRELGGTGLGLSIVKHVVLAHGGEVGVESVPGRGSTFRVSLPLA
ncbi:MAG: ATP-binding protein [Planctomycetota bacterium]